jgi:hypothetical protein
VAVQFRGMAQVKAMVEDYGDAKMRNRMRRGAYAGAKVFQGAVKATAASRHGAGTGNVPLSEQRVPAPKVTTRGGVGGRDIEAYVRPKSSLFNILEPGARGHTIAPGSSVTGRPGRRGGKARKPTLGGPAGSGGWTPAGRKRKGAFYSRRPVQHPGVAARPILAPAFNAVLPAAEDAIAAVLFAPTTGGGRL